MKRPYDTTLLRLLPALALAGLSSCAQTSLNPADWYHAIEGGKVADERPPPPKVNAPYPNLGSVPERPAPIDQAARGVIAQGLVADRTNAQYSASMAPLPPPANPGNTANRPVPPTPRPAGEEAAGASLPAASAPPPAAPTAVAGAAARPIGPLGPPQPNLPNVPMAAPRAAPTKAVASSNLPPPVGVAPPGAPQNAPQPPDAAEPANVGARAGAVMGVGRPAEPAASLPTVPALPPAPPVLPGAVASATSAPPPGPPLGSPPGSPPGPPPKPAPALVAAPPVAAVADPAPVAGGSVLIPFQVASSELPASALVSLKVLSQQRGVSPIAVTGYGDLTSTEANAQAMALPLALERARVVAARLLALGVPSNAIRINAEAQGRGASARIMR